MTTVTAKELREKLSTIIDRVEAGEEVVVIRRSKPAIRLISERPLKGNSRQILQAIKRHQAYIAAAGITIKADPNKSIKELYHEAMDNDPKYARYVTKARTKANSKATP